MLRREGRPSHTGRWRHTAVALLCCLQLVCASHRYRFDDEEALGHSDSPQAPRAVSVGSVLHRISGGVRASGGYVELGGGSHLQVGEADAWQVGTDFSVSMWLRPRLYTSGSSAAVFSIGSPLSRQRCIAWSSDEFASLPIRIPVQNFSSVNMDGCKQTCSELSECEALTFDTDTLECRLYDCSPGDQHCAVTNTSVSSSLRLTRCATHNPSISVYATSTGTLGLRWNGELCEMDDALSNDAWSLVTISVSTYAFVTQGLVRLSRLSPGVQEATCYSTAWFFRDGLPMHNGFTAAVGFDMTRYHSYFTGDVDDFTVSRVGADVGALTKQVGVTLGIVLEELFEGTDTTGASHGDVEVRIGGGIKGNSLAINMQSSAPSDAVYTVDSEGLPSVGSLDEFTICAWVKPMCFADEACGMPWAVRNPTTGRRTAYLELRATGDVAHTLQSSTVVSTAPQWVGCFAVTSYATTIGRIYDAITIRKCSALCPYKYFALRSQQGPCYCSDEHPSQVMRRAPDSYCEDACLNEESTATPQHCGAKDKDYVAAYEHSVAAKYVLGDFSTPCYGAHGAYSDPRTEEECARAAAVLKLHNSTVTEFSDYPPGSYPRGCLYDPMHTRLYWNPNGDAHLEVASDDIEYRRICRTAGNAVWKRGRWQWICATKDTAGVHRLYVDGSREWEGATTLEGHEFSFSDGDVIELGGGGRSSFTQFRGEVDGLRFSRKAERALLEGHQRWRLQDLNRVYHTNLVDRLQTGLAEFNRSGHDQVSAYIAQSVDLRGKLATWRVRHSGAYVDMDAVVTSAALANYSNGPLLRNGLLASYRQEYGNDTTLLLRNAHNAVNPNAYAGSCPTVTITASSSMNYTMSAQALRRPDNVPWKPYFTSVGWVRWTYAQDVEVVGIYIKAHEELTLFERAALEISSDGDTWEVLYYITPELVLTMQHFTGWGVRTSKYWRLSMNGNRFSDELAVDYAAPVVLGFSSPCGAPSLDCRYPSYAKGVRIDDTCNSTTGSSPDMITTMTLADGSYSCRDACNDEPECMSYSYHIDTDTCYLSRGICGLNLTASGWVTYTGKTGCTQTSARPSSDDAPVDTAVTFHPSLGATILKSERTSYARGGAPLLIDTMFTIAQGKRCSDENETMEGLPNKIRGPFPTQILCEAFCKNSYDCHYCSASVCFITANLTTCSYAPLRTCTSKESIEIDKDLPLRAKHTHYIPLTSNAPSQSRCDAGCAVCGARECPTRQLNLQTLLNDTGDEALSGVHFGVRGAFRYATEQPADAAATPTATLTLSLSHTFSLPTDTATLSKTLTPTLTETDTFSLTPTATTVSATLSETDTVTLPTATVTDTLTLPTVTGSSTLTISITESLSITVLSHTLPTLTFTWTVPTPTETMTIPTATATPTLTLSLSIPTPTVTTGSSTLTFTLPSATVTFSATVYSFSTTSTLTTTLSFPTPTVTVAPTLGGVADYSVGVNVTWPFVHEQELLLFDTDAVSDITIDVTAATTLPNGKVVSGNFETAGDAQLCSNTSGVEMFCLTPPIPVATGAVHAAAPLHTKDKVLRVYARFGVGEHSYNAAGGWAIALHKVGPVLGAYGSGLLYGLSNTDWHTVSKGLYILYDATVSDQLSGGRVLVVSDDSEDGTFNKATVSLPYEDTIATPGMSWSTWIELHSAGKLKVYVSTNSTDRPHAPAVETTLSTPLQDLLETDSAYVSTIAASGCGEVTVTAKAGFYLKEVVRREPYPSWYYPEHHTEIEVIVKGVSMKFGFRPGKSKGDARVVANNGTTLYSGRSMGWTPLTDTMHTMQVTLRTGGVHTFTIMSYDGDHTYSEDFTWYGLWTSNNSISDVTVVFNVDGGYIYRDEFIPNLWWQQGTHYLTGDVGTVKTIADQRRYYFAPASADGYHRAALESVSCAAVQHLLLEMTASTEYDANAPTVDMNTTATLRYESIQEHSTGALLFEGDPARFLSSGDALHYYFPVDAFAVDFWVKYADPSIAGSGLVSYTRPQSTCPDFQIHDTGSEWVVTLLQEDWAVSVRDVWNPLSPLEAATYGYRCANSETSDDILVGGSSFSSLAQCETFCSNSPECTVCTPYRCDGASGTCLCSFRALRTCVKTSVLPTGCAHQPTVRKQPGWVHVGFRWRSVDGCWSLLRQGRPVHSGCGLAKGHTVPAGGNLVLGQRISAAGHADWESAFKGAMCYIRLWDRYPDDAALRPFTTEKVAGEWPLVGDLLDASGHGRHLRFSGTPMRFSAAAPDPQNLPPERLIPLEPINAHDKALLEKYTAPLVGAREEPEATVPPELVQVSGVTALSMTSADIDGDSIEDVVLVDVDGAVSWVSGKDVSSAPSSGSRVSPLVKHPIGVASPECAGVVHAADVNADGRADVFLSCDQTVFLWVSSGDPVSFLPQTVTPEWAVEALGARDETMPSPEPFNGVCITDVDGDDVSDIVVSFKDTSLLRQTAPTPAAPLAYHLKLDGNTHSASGQLGLTSPDVHPIWVDDVRAEGEGAAYFDGASDRCGYGPTLSDLGTATALTWSAWVRLNASLSENVTVIGYFNTTFNDYYVDAANESTTLFSIVVDPTYGAVCAVDTDRVVTSGLSLSMDVWHLIVCVWDGAAGTLQGYQDGQSQGASPVGVKAIEGSSNRLLVGCSLVDTNTSLHGYIDDIRISTTALSRKGTLEKYYTSLHVTFDEDVQQSHIADSSGFARAVYVQHADLLRSAPGCPLSRCVALDRDSGGYIGGDLLSNVVVEGAEQLSILLWVHIPASPLSPSQLDATDNVPLFGSPDLANMFGMYYNVRTAQVMCVFTSEHKTVRVLSVHPVSRGEWVHVMCTYSGYGTAGQGAAAVFINMANSGYTNTTDADVRRLTPPARSFRVGGGFEGLVDDLRVMFTALQPQDFTEVLSPPASLVYHIHDQQYYTNDTNAYTGMPRVVDIPPLPIAQSAPMTLSFWVFPMHDLPDLGDGANEGCFLELGAPHSPAREVICLTSSGVSIDKRAFFAATIPTGSWTHVALRYNGLQATLYTNGSRHPPKDMTFQVPWQYDLAVGALGQGFEGWVKDFRVYAAALLQSQIQGLARSGSIGYIPGRLGGDAGVQFANVLVVNQTGRLSATVSGCLDYDRDGDVDVVVTAQSGTRSTPQLVLLENAGVGDFSQTQLVPRESALNTLSLSVGCVRVTTPSLSSDHTPEVFAIRADGSVLSVTSSGGRYLPSTADTICTGTGGWQGTTAYGSGNASCAVHVVSGRGDAGLVVAVEIDNRVYVGAVDYITTSVSIWYSLPRGSWPVAGSWSPLGFLVSTESGVFASPEHNEELKHTSPSAGGMVMALPFDEEQGLHVHDAVADGHGAIIDSTPEVHLVPVYPVQWLGGDGLFLNSYAKVVAPLQLKGNVDALTVQLWMMRDCSTEGGALVAIKRVFNVVLNGTDFFVSHPSDSRRLCGARLQTLRGCKEWHSVAVSWERHEGFRLFLDGRALLACSEDAINVDVPDGLGAYEVTVGNGFKGRVKQLQIFDRVVPQDALLEAYHTQLAHGRVPKFVPVNANVCPAAQGWQLKPSHAGTCGRAFGVRGISRVEAAHRCKSHGDCSWALESLAVPDSAVYSVLHVASLQACRATCCDDTTCRAALFHETTCSLVADLSDVTPTDKQHLSVVVRQHGAYHFAFDGSLDDTHSEAILIAGSPSDPPPVFVGGRSGQACELRDSQVLSTSLDGQVSLQMWSLSVWIYRTSSASAVSINGTRCHFGLNSDVYFCDTTTGGELRTPDATLRFDGTPADDTWHFYEFSYDGHALSFARDCDMQESFAMNITVSNPTVRLLSVGVLPDTDNTTQPQGVWRYDDLTVFPHVVLPCGAPHLHHADTRRGGRMVGIASKSVNSWVTSLAGSRPVWVDATYRKWEGAGRFDYAHQCSPANPWVVSGADGQWSCSNRRGLATAVCEVPVSEQQVDAAPVLRAVLPPEALPRHTPTGVWTTVLQQRDTTHGGGFFPQGYYTTSGSPGGSVFLDLAIDWTRHRQADGSVELRLSFPLGACDGTYPEDVIWRQRSLPSATGPIDGFVRLQVPTPAHDGVAFTGLSRSKGSLYLLQTHAAPWETAFGIGNRQPTGCGLSAPGGGAGVHAITLFVRVPSAPILPNPVTVAFWVKARAEPDSADWSSAAFHDCPGPRCGCEKGAAVHTGRYRRSAVATSWTDGAKRASLSSNINALAGGVWTCTEDNTHPANTSRIPNWQSLRLGTRKYGLFSYWRDGAQHPDIAVSCEGSGAARGSCEIVAGNPGSAVNGRLHINTPELVPNHWAGDEWCHFAMTWEAEQGCYSLYRDGQMVAAGCDHNVGGGIGGGGHLLLAHGAVAPGRPADNSAVFGSLADFTMWGRRLDPDEVLDVYRGRPRSGYVVRWRLRAPNHLHDEAGLVNLVQEGLLHYHTHDPPTPRVTEEGLRVTFPGRNFAGLWTGETAAFTDGSSGVSVCLWHKSVDTTRTVFSYIQGKAAQPALAFSCLDGMCHVHMASTGNHSVSFPDSLLSQYWSHCCVVLHSGVVEVYVNGTQTPTKSGAAYVVQATAAVHASDAWKVLDGAVNMTSLDTSTCYTTGANESDWLYFQLSGKHTVTSLVLYGAAGDDALSAGWTVHVGDLASEVDPVCKRGVSLLGPGPHTVTCSTPLTGSRVSIYSASGLQLCEVKIQIGGSVALPPSGVFTLGTDLAGYDDARHFSGSLAEVRVFTSSLSWGAVHREMRSSTPMASDIWAWWRLDSLEDSSGHDRHLVPTSTAAVGGVQGRWTHLFTQKYPSSWAGGFEKIDDGSQFAALGRMAQEHRRKDGRFVMRLQWADLAGGEEVWWQTTDPTKQYSVEGFHSSLTHNNADVQYGGLLRGDASTLLVGLCPSANTTHYAVGTLLGDVAPAFPGATSQDVRLYTWDSVACQDSWTSQLSTECTSRYVEYLGQSIDSCKQLCRSFTGCTGFSFPCSHAADCCRVHVPQLPAAVDATFTASMDGSGEAFGVDVLLPGRRLWDGVNTTAVPDEMMGSYFMVLPDMVRDNQTFSVTVNESSLLYVVFEEYHAGGFDALLNTTGDGLWQEVFAPLVVDTVNNATLRILKTPIARGIFTLPTTRTQARMTLATKSLNAGEDPPADCVPLQSEGFRYFAYWRDCNAEMERMSGLQCHPGTSCDTCISGTGGFVASVVECHKACQETASCRYFTLYENGWCSLLHTCVAFYNSGWQSRGGCMTYRLQRESTLSVEPQPPLEWGQHGRLSAYAYQASGNTATKHPVVALSVWPSSFTIEWWMKPSDTGCGCSPLSFTSFALDNFAVEIADGTVSAVVVGGARVAYPAPDLLLRRDEWVHMAVTWSERTHECSIFVNGVLRATATIAQAATLQQTGVLRVGHYFPSGFPDPSKGFIGEIMHVRLWEGDRSASHISMCRRQTAEHHADLLGAWPLQNSLLDTSGWSRHMDLAAQSVWDETDGISWQSADWVTQLADDIADTSSKCSAACAVDPTCYAWKWENGLCKVTIEQDLVWVQQEGVMGGRFKHCAGLQWDEYRKTTLYSLPDPLPTYTKAPYWWHFNVTLSKEACVAACHSVPLCTAWTWFRDSAACYGVQTPDWKAVFVDGVVSGDNMVCERYPQAAVVAVPGRKLLNKQHAAALCASVKGNLASLQDAQHLRWLAQEVQIGTYNTTSDGAVAIAHRSGGNVETFASQDVTALFAGLAGLWDVDVFSYDGYLGFPLEYSNVSLVSWAANSTASHSVLCEHTAEAVYNVHDVTVQHSGGTQCVGSTEERCAGWCTNGHCMSALGPCVCHDGFYPPGVCTTHCDGVLLSNGTVCQAPRPVMQAHPKQVVQTLGTDSIGITEPEGRITPKPTRTPSIPMLHTTAVHLVNTRTTYRVKITRGSGKSCRTAPHPVSPRDTLTFVGFTDTADECAELVDSKFERSAFFLWDVQEQECHYTIGDVTERGPHNTTFIGCRMEEDSSDDDACASRPHSPWSREPELVSNGAPRGNNEVVYYATIEEPGRYLVCYQSLAEDPAGGAWMSVNELHVRAWSCQERRSLVPSLACVP